MLLCNYMDMLCYRKTHTPFNMACNVQYICGTVYCNTNIMLNYIMIRFYNFVSIMTSFILKSRCCDICFIFYITLHCLLDFLGYIIAYKNYGLQFPELRKSHTHIHTHTHQKRLSHTTSIHSVCLTFLRVTSQLFSWSGFDLDLFPGLLSVHWSPDPSLLLTFWTCLPLCY